MKRLVEASFDDDRLHLEEVSLVALIHFLDTEDLPWSIPPGDLAVAFLREENCRELHGVFFQDDSVTDVMTFPGTSEDDHAGDLAVCPSYAADHAPEYGQSFAEELTLYVVHGWLHLAGLDDRTIEATQAMRAAEKFIMDRLRTEHHLLAASWQD